MLQYKVPQNVGIEDKIVGPFSLRQMLIIGIGGAVSYVLFAISSRVYELNSLEYLLISLPGLFSLAIAMLKIHNVTLTKYILLMLEFAINPKKRMWDHRGISALVAPDLTEKSEVRKKNNAEESGLGRKNVNLKDLSTMLDSGGFSHVDEVRHEDIDKVDDDDLITQAYFGRKNMYWRTRDTQKKKLDLLAKIPAAKKMKAEKSDVNISQKEKVDHPENPLKKSDPQKESPEKIKQEMIQTPQVKAEMTPNITPENPVSIKKSVTEVETNQIQKSPEPITQNSTPVYTLVKKGILEEKNDFETPNTDRTQEDIPIKSKRKRKRKKKGSQTQRESTQEQRNTPLITPTPSTTSSAKEVEMSMDDLERGDEIEFNLD